MKANCDYCGVFILVKQPNKSKTGKHFCKPQHAGMYIQLNIRRNKRQ